MNRRLILWPTGARCSPGQSVRVHFGIAQRRWLLHFVPPLLPIEPSAGCRSIRLLMQTEMGPGRGHGHRAGGPAAVVGRGWPSLSRRYPLLYSRSPFQYRRSVHLWVVVGCNSYLVRKSRGHFVCWQGAMTTTYLDISRNRNVASAQKGPGPRFWREIAGTPH